MEHQSFSFWHWSAAKLMEKLRASSLGLDSKEAAIRLKKLGAQHIRAKKNSMLVLFLSQFKSPLILLLIVAAILSFSLKDKTDAVIILVIVLGSGILSFFQERGATLAVSKLLAIVQVKALVIRGGHTIEVPMEEVVPGDIVLLSAGDMIPGDCFILESKDCFVDEATLTGETFHVEKKEGILPEDTPLAKRTNTLFMGSHMVSGAAKALVIFSGKQTEFGKVAERLKLRPPETSFENGLRHFGYLLLEVTLILVIAIFAFNIYLQRPVLESFMFALALAVGLTPQLLPAIVSINLARGAKRMAKEKVIVKRLSSIENFGSMNVLCADKTGTLTDGVAQLDGWVDCEGAHFDEVLQFSYLNASMQTGYSNPIDEAIVKKKKEFGNWHKRDEIPYDFIRKRLSVLASDGKELIMITKGAFSHMLPICSKARKANGEEVSIESVREPIEKLFSSYCEQGFRAIGVAIKSCSSSSITRDDEDQMTFLGFLLFFDPLKPGIAETVQRLKEMGVSLKIISGDHRLVTAHISEQVGLKNSEILTGRDMRHMSDNALMKKVQHVNLFAEVEPNQKERIILSLRKAGYVVGFLGDGINDATALHTADVGISVNTSVDVAKEVADIVMLKKDLSALLRGVREGRKTFANTLKYVFMASSANFGNMFSMAGISVFLPFLPLLPKQILLMNLLTDVPEMTIATDHVDHEVIEKPVKWDIKMIKSFMILFGWISSLFDFLTFGILLFVLRAPSAEFRTGWFIESVTSAAAIVLVIRTRKPFFESRPSPYLSWAVAGVIALTFLLPLTPLGTLFGFVPLPIGFYCAIIAIVGLYVFSVELAKKQFYKNHGSLKGELKVKAEVHR